MPLFKSFWNIPERFHYQIQMYHIIASATKPALWLIFILDLRFSRAKNIVIVLV